MITTNFQYFLKNYMRVNGFNVSELASITKLSRAKMYEFLDFDHLPAPDEIKSLIEKLKAPAQLAWQAYFNSILLQFHHEPTIELCSYTEYEQMVANNKKRRRKLKQRAVPYHEGMISIFGPWALNPMPFNVLIGVNDKNKESRLKDADISNTAIKQLVKGDRFPTTEELFQLVCCDDHYTAYSYLRGFISMIISRYNLDYFVGERSSEAQRELLNRQYKS